MEETLAMIRLFCLHCHHEWEAAVDRETLRRIVAHEPVATCPKCGLPT